MSDTKNVFLVHASKENEEVIVLVWAKSKNEAYKKAYKKFDEYNIDLYSLSFRADDFMFINSCEYKNTIINGFDW